MKRILRSVLLASCLAGVVMPLRAQSVQDDAGTVTTDTGRAGDATRLGKDEVEQPAGESQGADVTGAETTAETNVEPSDTEKKQGESSAATEESSGSQK